MIVLLREVWENPRKRRHRLEIIARILTAARDGVHKTQIMYQAGLSFAQFNAIRPFLSNWGFLKLLKEMKRSSTKQLLKAFNTLKDMRN